MAKRALIFGISGQDGGYLAEHLLREGYAVYGTSRDAELSAFDNLKALAIRDRVHLISAYPSDFRSVMQAVKAAEPDEIYNLSGQSSVGLSFSQPMETMESIVTATLNLLEAIRFLAPGIRFYNASSSECYGHTGSLPATEDTPFRPRSPYATAKAAAHWAVANYRDAYGLFACSGILFNHESPLRPMRFVTRKVVAAAARIAAGIESGPLRLGNLDIWRDWGWAPEYVEVIWRILQTDRPRDYIVATGHSWPLKDFVAEAFSLFDLDWREHVKLDASLCRPSDIVHSAANPERAAVELGWRARVLMPEVVRRMAEREKMLLATG
ncbi:MAG: NAD-dependent dehydratase [Acidithiobacillales bacterium SM23_46]|nr:MAG: NAD-dependent dehydratase [Thiotrichales bacterium SG8_50]KPK68211.1 MAG: NAD-dependent dehydratase [Acidithiobacillales bacterium SM23_46]